MSDVRFLLVFAAAISSLRTVRCGEPRIAHSQYVYRTHCVYASFLMSFDIVYDTQDGTGQATIKVPEVSEVHLNSTCNDTNRELVMSWQNNTVSLAFRVEKGKWKLDELTLVFNLTAISNHSIYSGLQSLHTNKTDFFKRTFRTSQYFYCEHCKTYEFAANNESVCQDNCQSPCVNNKSCSAVHMEKSVIYPGDPSNADKRLCLEDYIALQEIIVPIVVGGVLALLLIFILLAYIIAYVRRRRREAKSQYEPVGDF